jgi:hypothetical protein
MDTLVTMDCKDCQRTPLEPQAHVDTQAQDANPRMVQTSSLAGKISIVGGIQYLSPWLEKLASVIFRVVIEDPLKELCRR